MLHIDVFHIKIESAGVAVRHVLVLSLDLS